MRNEPGKSVTTSDTLAGKTRTPASRSASSSIHRYATRGGGGRPAAAAVARIVADWFAIAWLITAPRHATVSHAGS